MLSLSLFTGPLYWIAFVGLTISAVRSWKKYYQQRMLQTEQMGTEYTRSMFYMEYAVLVFMSMVPVFNVILFLIDAFCIIFLSKSIRSSKPESI